MGRIKLAMLVIGGVMVFLGVQEFLVSRGTKTEPVAADLARLEAGDLPPPTTSSASTMQSPCIP
jgi:hypothetical protein